MRKTLVNTIIATAIVTSLSGHALANTHTQENDTKSEYTPAIGMGSGVLVGAVIAGPIGAAVGGIFGAMIGNDVLQEEELKHSEMELVAAKQALTSAQKELFAMHDANESMQQQVKATHVAMESSPTERVLAIETNVQFKTGSAEVEDVYKPQLDLIASAMKRHDQLKVRLIGHADHRGNAQYNKTLSMQRATSVKAYLVDKGVDSEQILTLALGEDKSSGVKGESAFFDRKVVVQIADSPNALTASR